MDPDPIAKVLVFGFAGLVVGLPLVVILRSIVAAHRRNTSFLAAAPSVDVPLGATAALRFAAASTATHALWLDLVLRGRTTMKLDVQVRISCDGVELLRLHDEVEFDDEGDARGFSQQGSGSVGLNNSYRSGPFGARVATVARVALFAPQGAQGLVEVAVRPGEGAALERCRAVVTPRTEP